MKKIFAGLAILFLLWLFLFGFLRNSYQIPVLMYHGIDNNPGNSRLLICEKTFEKQMSFLKKNRYNILTIDEYVKLVKKGGNFSRKSVVITFDDGFENNYLLAYPILKKYHIPAVIFVITGKIGEAGMLNWRQIEELNNEGLVTIGSHGISHCDLTKSDDKDAQNELVLSKQTLEEKLKKTIKYFCYPCGFFTTKIKEMVKAAGYEGACATHPPKRVPLNDVYAIRRVRISQSADNLFVFRTQISGYYDILRGNSAKKIKKNFDY